MCSSAAQQALAPDAAPLRFAAQALLLTLGAGDMHCYVFRKIGGKWRLVGM